MNTTPTKHIIICFFFLPAILSFYACSKKDSPPPPKVDTAPKIAITSLSADSGVYNASVTITGTGFDKNVANDKVFFNGKAATITAATATQLTVLVPLAAGTGKVSVKVNDGTEVNGPVFNYKQSWIVSTFAGSGVAGFTDGDGAGATLNQPVGITIDGNGDFFITEQGNHAVRKITAAGKVTTIAGNGNSGKVNGKGSAASFDHPAGIRADKAGNLYIADHANNLIRKIDASGNVTTMAGTGAIGFDNGSALLASFTGPTDLVLNSAGDVFVSDYVNEAIRKISKGGVVSTFSSSLIPGVDDHSHGFHFPSGLTVDKNDNIYVVDQTAYTIKKITPSGIISVFAGNGLKGVIDGQGNKAGFFSPYMLTIDKNGTFYVTDGNQIRKIDKDVNVTLFAGVTDHGSVNGAAAVSSFYTPIGIVTDQDGNVYVADTSNNLIRKIAFQ
ncbi:NHL repeat-containing protein [Mucilaginibacter gossypiicola]|uniref:NHL repeat-containing protein n=1 Tax=Mucilaginibacter gossypiicola TaxID=551995 RepID=A0A1H8P4X9_9SPHI|nr:NHL repeat-containing protein [Mucilaginibacter gossypiicola]SEO36814.1 NHL repeat-containing protein [Mucilaginibacter gossypiicola]